MTEKELKVVRAMEVFGGSFVKSLASCFYKADPNNLRRLKKAFPEYWEQYTDMADQFTFTKNNNG